MVQTLWTMSGGENLKCVVVIIKVTIISVRTCTSIYVDICKPHLSSLIYFCTYLSSIIFYPYFSCSLNPRLTWHLCMDSKGKTCNVAQAVQPTVEQSDTPQGTVVLAFYSLLLCCSQPFGFSALCCQNLQPGCSAQSGNTGRGSQSLISQGAVFLSSAIFTELWLWLIKADDSLVVINIGLWGR